jgi:hypothetical protein
MRAPPLHRLIRAHGACVNAVAPTSAKSHWLSLRDFALVWRRTGELIRPAPDFSCQRQVQDAAMTIIADLAKTPCLLGRLVYSGDRLLDEIEDPARANTRLHPPMMAGHVTSVVVSGNLVDKEAEYKETNGR